MGAVQQSILYPVALSNGVVHIVIKNAMINIEVILLTLVIMLVD